MGISIAGNLMGSRCSDVSSVIYRSCQPWPRQGGKKVGGSALSSYRNPDPLRNFEDGQEGGVSDFTTVVCPPDMPSTNL